jgi:hypothetical protein
MENNGNESIRKITVDIHGETDWLRFSFDTTKLDALNNSSVNSSSLGNQLGRLLNDDPVNELSELKKSEVSELLAKYVANLKSYQIMLSEGYQSLMITVCRIKNGSSSDYAIRVAGMLTEDLNETTLFVNGIPEPLHSHHFVLLHLLKKSSHLYTEKYHKKSTFHDLIRQSNLTSGKIEFRKQADPHLQ